MRGVGNGNKTIPAAFPTDSLPGTPERIAVLQERARLGQSLTHPEDRQL